MSFENLDLNEELEEEPAPPEESSNRTFIIIAGVLGAIALLALVCIAVYALVLLPRTRNAQEAQRATLDAQNTEVAAIIERTSTAAEKQAIEAAYTHTPTNTLVAPTFTPTSSPTPVVAMPTTAVAPLATDTPNAQTATAVALFATLDANATRLASTFTARPGGQATSIPNTGFADDIGLPAMIGMAVLLIAIIFLARRLRTA
jgi:hypothetical protein